MFTLAPTASIFPSRITTVPFSMSGPLTVTMRALRIANVPRAGITPCCAVGFPICCPSTEPVHRINKMIVFMSAGTAARCLRRLALRARSIRFGLLERGAFLRELRASSKILRAIEINLTVDKRRINARVDAERMSIPDRDVRILTDFDRTDTILNAELYRGIDRNELQRLLFRQVAPVHRLRRFDVQAARALVGVGVH